MNGIERPSPSRSRTVPLLLVLPVLVGAVVVGALLTRSGEDVAVPTPTTAAPPTPGVTAPATTVPVAPTVDPEAAASERRDRVRRLLTNPGAAAAASRDELDLAVAEATTTGDWLVDEWGTLDPAAVEAGRDHPLVVGQATVDPEGRVTFDVAWSVPRSLFGEVLTFRVLPADPRLGGGFDLQSLLVDDVSRIDDATALVAEVGELRIDGIPADAEDTTVRILGSYTVPERTALPPTEDPIGYGLLARTGDVTALGHWLPVPTFDTGPYADTGADIGAFPAATWSVVVVHPGLLVTGGNEGSCVSPQAALDRPDRPDLTECTWARARNLRDLSAVVIGSGDQDNPFTYLDREGESLGLVELHGDDRGAIVDETAATWSLLHDLFGPLPWGELDVVAVPLRPAAAGMEFPGMIWVDPGVLGVDAGFGTYVLTHEVAHQWFHGLLGNGSLSDPVIDEPLAQYGAYLAVAAIHGQDAADRLDASYVTGRYQRGLQRGDDEAPAMPVAAFRSEASYGSAVYGRAGAAWIDADRELGRDRVTAAVRQVVDGFRLAPATTASFLDALTAADPELGARIARAWGVEVAEP